MTFPFWISPPSSIWNVANLPLSRIAAPVKGTHPREFIRRYVTEIEKNNVYHDQLFGGIYGTSSRSVNEIITHYAQTAAGARRFGENELKKQINYVAGDVWEPLVGPGDRADWYNIGVVCFTSFTQPLLLVKAGSSPWYHRLHHHWHHVGVVDDWMSNFHHQRCRWWKQMWGFDVLFLLKNIF